jgi:RNA polymerase sigma factor (sigma-70 family)
MGNVAVINLSPPIVFRATELGATPASNQALASPASIVREFFAAPFAVANRTAPSDSGEKPGDFQGGSDMGSPGRAGAVAVPGQPSGPAFSDVSPTMFSIVQPAAAATPPASPVVSVTALVTAASSEIGFRISQVPPGNSELEVHYTLNAYAGNQAVSQDGSALLAPESPYLDLSATSLSANRLDAPELILLTLHEGAGYQIGKRAATAFTASAGTSCSEAALLGAYQQGRSEEAFAVLVNRYRDTVFQTCYRLLGNRHDAEDVLQFVFLALAQGSLRLQCNLGGWLRTVARHAAITLFRSRSRRARHERLVARRELEPPDEGGEEWNEELVTALDSLPAALEEAVRLRYLEGRSQHEAAGLLGVPRGTVAQRAARGIHRLRDVLDRRGTVIAHRPARQPLAQSV